MAQINKKWIKNDAVNQDKIRLDNDGSLRARNNANTADVDLLKLDTSDKPILQGGIDDFRLANNPSGTVSTAVASVGFVNSAIAGLGDILSLKGGLDASAIGSQLDNVEAGSYYRVTVAGTLFGTNPIELAVGDALICINDVTGTPDDGVDFFKIDNTELDDQTGLEVPVTAAYNSAAASGNVTGGSDNVQTALEKIEKKADTNATNISSNDTDIADLVTLSGVAANSSDLGTFTGSTITDNVTVKTALQELETEVELKADSSVVTEIDQNVDDLVTLSGVAENSTDLGTFTGSTITDSVTVKTALQELETEVELKADSSVVTEIDQNVDDLITLSGVAENDTDLGTFTGSTITDNVTVKAALQELETALETASVAVPQEEILTLIAGDITNQYVDLAASASNAASISVTPVDGPMQEKGVDYTVSLTGGAGGVTRLTFAGDLATGGDAELVAGDKLIIRYESE